MLLEGHPIPLLGDGRHGGGLDRESRGHSFPRGHGEGRAVRLDIASLPCSNGPSLSDQSVI